MREGIHELKFKSTGWSSCFYPRAERRREARFYRHFLIRVRGHEKSGKVFKIDGLLDNISPSGLFLRIPRKLDLGARVLIGIRFSTEPADQEMAARVAVRGRVLRQEHQQDGFWGLALTVSKSRFIY
jgi:hypothetical protein